MADKRKATTTPTTTTPPDDTPARPDADLGPSNLDPPADAQKTDDGYIYPDSGSFVVETHKGEKAKPAPQSPQHPAGRRRG